MTERVRVSLLSVAMLLIPVPSAANSDVEALAPALDKLQHDGDPEGAVRLALEVARDDPENTRAWFLCGMLRHHNLADFAGAVECLDQVMELVKDHGKEFSELRHVLRGRGMSHFMLGQFAQAETDLRAGVELEPDGVHAHLLWYLAVERAGKNGEPRLREFAGAHQSAEWPHPLVAFYLDETTAEDAIAPASKRPGDLCEAHFYVGEFYLLRDEKQLAAAHFEQAVATGNDKYGEYQMSRAELQRLTD